MAAQRGVLFKITWSDGEGESSEHMVETLTLTVEDVEVL